MLVSWVISDLHGRFFNSVDDDDVALIIHYFQVDLDFRNTAKFPYVYFV